MTPAQKYIASLYEQAVDACLDTNQVRRYLLDRGVLRTPGQVAWELEHEFGFIGYADSHQPAPAMSQAAYDRAVGHA